MSKQCVPGRVNPCIFEYIYLARPDSVLNNISVYNFQMGLGTRLAERIKWVFLSRPLHQPSCGCSVGLAGCPWHLPAERLHHVGSICSCHAGSLP